MPVAVAPVVAIVLSLAPWLGERRAREVARPIAEVTSTLDDAALLAVVARRESDFRREVETCEVTGDAGRAVSMYQLHAHHWGAGGRERICRDPRWAAWRTLQALGTGTAEDKLTRFMGRRPDDPEIRHRLELLAQVRP